LFLIEVRGDRAVVVVVWSIGLSDCCCLKHRMIGRLLLFGVPDDRPVCCLECRIIGLLFGVADDRTVFWSIGFGAVVVWSK